MSDLKHAVFFGELLMRLGTKHFERFVQAREFEVGYTGAEANVAVSLAAAASCLKHSIHSDLNEVSLQELLALAGGTGSGRIVR